MDRTVAIMNSMAAKSAELQALLLSARLVGKRLVNAADIARLNRLADKHGLRRWERTRDERDYDELIALVCFHF